MIYCIYKVTGKSGYKNMRIQLTHGNNKGEITCFFYFARGGVSCSTYNKNTDTIYSHFEKQYGRCLGEFKIVADYRFTEE